MKKTLIAIIIYLFTGSYFIYAQSVQFLINPADAASLGLAGTTVAIDANSFAIYNNPASMALARQKMMLGLSYGNWQPKGANNSLLTFSGYYNIKEKLGVGFGFRSFSHQAYPISTLTGLTEATFKPVEYAVDLGFAYRVAPQFSTGINMKYIGSSIAQDAKGSSFAIDAGMMYQNEKVNVAFSICNIGSQISYGATKYSLPMMAKLGGAYRVDMTESHLLTLSAEGDYIVPAKVMMMGLGAQYTFQNMLKVRTGYHYGDNTKSIPSYFSAGLGVAFSGISVDFSMLLSSPSEILKNSFLLGVSYSM